MNKRLRNNSGISVVVLVLTIILILILTSVAIYYSNNITPEAKLASAFSSLGAIKEASERALYEIDFDPEKYDEYYFFGKNLEQTYTNESELNDLAIRCGLSSAADFSSRSYIISDSEDVDNRRRLENLEITGISQTYIADIGNNRYYIVDGVRKSDLTKVYEYREIMRSYSMLTQSH